MKFKKIVSLIVLLSILLIPVLSYAKDIVSVYIYPANGPLSTIDPASGLQSPSVDTLSKEAYRMQSMYYPKDPRTALIVFKNETWIARFFDRTTQKLLTVSQLDPKMAITITVNNKPYLRAVTPKEGNMSDINITLDESLWGNDAESFANNTDVTFGIKIDNNNYDFIITSPAIAKFFEPSAPYQTLGQNTRGVWIPALLFSSNFQSTSNGIQFASLPIGIAWGYKFYNRTTGFYWGLSAMGTIFAATEKGNTDVASSSSFNVQGFTGGILFDINDIFSIGYAYGQNFRTGYSNPGGMFVLGFGTKALGFLKKNKETTPPEKITGK